jgi:hypothetical protein
MGFNRSSNMLMYSSSSSSSWAADGLLFCSLCKLLLMQVTEAVLVLR